MLLWHLCFIHSWVLTCCILDQDVCLKNTKMEMSCHLWLRLYVTSTWADYAYSRAGEVWGYFGEFPFCLETPLLIIHPDSERADFGGIWRLRYIKVWAEFYSQSIRYFFFLMSAPLESNFVRCHAVGGQSLRNITFIKVRLWNNFTRRKNENVGSC